MRSVVFAAMLAMGGCAAASRYANGTELASLTPPQLRQAFAETAGCIVYEEDGLCESMIFVDSVSGRTAEFREVGANDIARFVAEPVAESVRQLPMFASYEEMFRQLEVQRRRGGFRYVKSVTNYVGTFNPETSLWCSPLGGGFEGTHFYFSNSLSASVAGDEPLDRELERQLQGFLDAVLDDPGFLGQFEPNSEERLGLELVRGNAESCIAYHGVLVSGHIEPRGLAIFADGVAISSLRNAIQPYSLGGTLPLRAN